MKEWPVPFWYVDTGVAALCMLLTAVAEGLGACLFGSQAEHRAGLRTEFRIPDAYEPVGGITIGYRHPDLAPQDAASIESRRRAKEEVVHRGQWRGSVGRCRTQQSGPWGSVPSRRRRATPPPTGGRRKWQSAQVGYAVARGGSRAA